jgi:hypothetical protein
MPGTPGQGEDNQHFRPPTREGSPTPVVPLNNAATAPMPLFGADPDEYDG